MRVKKDGTPYKTPVYQKRVVVDLSARMRAQGATNAALAERAGIGANTVATARRGDAVLLYVADAIDGALRKYTFKRDKRGARWVM